MMAFSQLSDEQYDMAADLIVYGKLFPKILEDFITRKDAAMMMKSSNLPVNTNVTTLVNTAVQVAVPAGTGTGVGKGTGNGTGTASPIYTGEFPSPESQILKQKRILEKETGVSQTEALTSGIEQVAGE
jgi:hypothetical protein